MGEKKKEETIIGNIKGNDPKTLIEPRNGKSRTHKEGGEEEFLGIGESVFKRTKGKRKQLIVYRGRGRGKSYLDVNPGLFSCIAEGGGVGRGQENLRDQKGEGNQFTPQTVGKPGVVRGDGIVGGGPVRGENGKGKKEGKK